MVNEQGIIHLFVSVADLLECVLAWLLLLLWAFFPMSRCFPYPPPGFDKKPRAEQADLIEKENHKEKKHKKEKKEKEKGEGKERKDKKDKHKEKKDRKEKHKDKKKDKEKDRENSNPSDDRRIEELVEPHGEEKLENGGPNVQVIKDHKFTEEFGRRIKDEERCGPNRMVENIAGSTRMGSVERIKDEERSGPNRMVENVAGSTRMGSVENIVDQNAFYDSYNGRASGNVFSVQIAKEKTLANKISPNHFSAIQSGTIGSESTTNIVNQEKRRSSHGELASDLISPEQRQANGGEEKLGNGGPNVRVIKDQKFTEEFGRRIKDEERCGSNRTVEKIAGSTRMGSVENIVDQNAFCDSVNGRARGGVFSVQIAKEKTLANKVSPNHFTAFQNGSIGSESSTKIVSLEKRRPPRGELSSNLISPEQRQANGGELYTNHIKSEKISPNRFSAAIHRGPGNELAANIVSLEKRRPSSRELASNVVSPEQRQENGGEMHSNHTRSEKKRSTGGDVPTTKLSNPEQRRPNASHIAVNHINPEQRRFGRSEMAPSHISSEKTRSTRGDIATDRVNLEQKRPISGETTNRVSQDQRRSTGSEMPPNFFSSEPKRHFGIEKAISLISREQNSFENEMALHIPQTLQRPIANEAPSNFISSEKRANVLPRALEDMEKKVKGNEKIKDKEASEAKRERHKDREEKRNKRKERDKHKEEKKEKEKMRREGEYTHQELELDRLKDNGIDCLASNPENEKSILADESFKKRKLSHLNGFIQVNDAGHKELDRLKDNGMDRLASKQLVPNRDNEKSILEEESFKKRKLSHLNGFIQVNDARHKELDRGKDRELDRGKDKELDRGKDNGIDCLSSKLPVPDRGNEKNILGDESLKKRKLSHLNGFIQVNDALPNKFPEPVQSSNPPLENGRISQSCHADPYSIRIDSAKTHDHKRPPINGFPEAASSSAEPHSAAAVQYSVATDSAFKDGVMNHTKASKMRRNGIISETIPIPSPVDPQPAHKKDNAEPSCKPPRHRDSKYLSRICAVPTMKEWPVVDDQEWLFASRNLQQKRPQEGESEVQEQPTVWDKAMYIKSADVISLPYVIPY